MNDTCAHQTCSQCQGTGLKDDRTVCVHFLSCQCSRCNPYSLNATTKPRKPHPWRTWNPDSMQRQQIPTRPDQQYNPKTRMMQRVR